MTYKRITVFKLRDVSGLGNIMVIIIWLNKCTLKIFMIFCGNIIKRNFLIDCGVWRRMQ